MLKNGSTYKVLAKRALQEDAVELWVDWALEMMMAGFETEHLIILAGLPQHINRFEFDDIVNKTLKELSLDNLPQEEVVLGYVYYLVGGALDSSVPVGRVLGELNDLCMIREYEKGLFPFYLLYHAQKDLETDGVQYYWDDADRSNIDLIINEEFHKWRKAFESKVIKVG